MVKLTIIVFISLVTTCLAAYSPGMRKVEAKIHLASSDELQGFQTGEQPPEQQKKQRKPTREAFGADAGAYRGPGGLGQFGFPLFSVPKPVYKPGWGLGGLGGLGSFGLGGVGGLGSLGGLGGLGGWGLGNWGLGGWNRPGHFWFF